MLETKLRESLMAVSTAELADARSRLGLRECHLEPDIRPVVPFSRMVGTAVTVRLEVAKDADSADASLMAQTAQTDAPGAIIVVQVPKELHSHGVVGRGVATRARRSGMVGALVDGAVRDTSDLREMGFPVFCRRIAPGFIEGKSSVAAVGDPVRIGGRTIEAGDVILEVDGASTEGWSLIESVIKIRGPEDSTVRLLVQHKNAGEPVVIEIVRSVIELESISWEMLPGEIVYFELSTFADNTDEILAEALADAGFVSAQGAIRYVSSEVVQKTPARTRQPVAPRIAGTAVPQRVAANTGASGDYNVQLGSYFSMSDANEAWKQFQKRYPEMGDAERVITKARVNGKIYYRVAAAGFAKSSAQTLCRSVKGKGGGCIAYASSRPLPGAIDVVDTGMRVAAR